MEKYLFSDGTTGVKEVQSEEELNTLIRSASRPDKIRIWIFNTNEWISYADFAKKPRHGDNSPAFLGNGNTSHDGETTSALKGVTTKKNRWLRKTLLFTLAGTTVFLVYNFTRIKWEKASPMHIMAARPANVPSINTDSLIAMLEMLRGQKIDKTTRTNLRIRNSWPERILLHLRAERETSNIGTKYHQLQVTLDNATGYLVDEAVVKLTVWKNNEQSESDTIQFKNTGYATPAVQTLTKEYRGDSLSVSFESIKAKSFNFCYSADKQSNYGNIADRWFCKE